VPRAVFSSDDVAAHNFVKDSKERPQSEEASDPVGAHEQPAAPGTKQLDEYFNSTSQICYTIPEHRALVSDSDSVSNPPAAIAERVTHYRRPERFRIEGQQERPRDLPFHQSEERLVQLALRTAMQASFPAEAMNQEPLGKYAKTFEEELQESGVTGRPKTTKYERDFVSRLSYDGVLVQKAMGFLLNPWSAGAASKKAAQLTWCLRHKPNLRYRGFASLSDAEFSQSRYKGDDGLYLRHMFEKHQGESIGLCVVDGPTVNNPGLLTMHNSQFFTNAKFDPQQRKAHYNARTFHQRRYTASREEEETLLREMRNIPNTVFQPVDGGRFCITRRIAYHSLQSLVWECCGEHQLMELYNLFCTSRLLTTVQSHAKRGSGRVTEERRRMAGGWL
jgi:hypothetical protein